jgi:branched-chain amino acid aminotransferase
MYREGVDLLTYPHIRPTPGIKKWDNAFRTSVSSFIRENNIYEAVLLNSSNQITEGSRSNLFFIDPKGQLISTPDELILPGITRKYLLDIARKQNIPVLEELISLDTLDTYVSSFISGTSPKVLPVKMLDNHPFEVEHPILLTLMKQFEALVMDNLTAL